MKRTLILLAMATASCAIRPNPADLVLTNGVVWTGEDTPARAEAVAIRGRRILAVGSAAEVRHYQGPGTRIIDLHGRLVLPGFIDAHTHFIHGGFQLASVDLRDARTPREFTRRLKEYAASVPEGRWITGGNWDHELWGGRLPDRRWIDSVTAQNPVFVSRLDLHMGLANTRALELAGITDTTRDPPGGTIVRDRGGRATGILKDEAMNLVLSVEPEPTQNERDEALRRAQQYALSLGITQIQDMGTWADLQTFERAHAEGTLKLRVYSFVPIATWQRLRDLVRATGHGDDRHHWGGVKGFVDGSLGASTAWLHEPYTDAPETRGLTVTDTAKLRAWVLAADAAGLQVAVHAIGDRANDWILDVYEQAERDNGPSDRRLRVEHAQQLTPQAIPRFARLGVIPSMQPYHAVDDGRWAERRLGQDRVRMTYALRALIDAGSRPAFGSDWTVAPLDPLTGVQAAVTRQTLDGKHPAGWLPEQKITVEEALLGYTRNAAYAGFSDRLTGTLRHGKRADLVVLSDDILRGDPARITDARVEMTMIDGAIVYERPR